jgi:hypothetical protein
MPSDTQLLEHTLRDQQIPSRDNNAQPSHFSGTTKARLLADSNTGGILLCFNIVQAHKSSVQL